MAALLPLLLAVTSTDVASIVENAARDAVTARLATIGRPMSVTSTPPALSATAVLDRASPVDVSGPMPRSRVVVPVHVLVDGHRRVAHVNVALRDVRTAPVYAQPYRRGTPVSDVTRVMREVDLASVREPLMSLPSAGVLARDVTQGAVATSGDVDTSPAVRVGSHVTLQAAQPRIHIETRARALEDGHVGDRITVFAEGSRRAVHARVLDPARVIADE